MSDMDLIQQLQEEIEADTDHPTLTIEIDPTDVIAVELLLLESDNAIDKYFEKFRTKYQSVLKDPEMFDDFVRAKQMQSRKALKEGIEIANISLRKLGFDKEPCNPFEEGSDGEK